MAGIPLTAGFVAKFSIFTQAMSAGQTGAFLVLIAVIGSALSIAYYLKLIIAMFFKKENSFEAAEKATITYQIMAIVIFISLLVFGVYPDAFKLQFGI